MGNGKWEMNNEREIVFIIFGLLIMFIGQINY